MDWGNWQMRFFLSLCIAIGFSVQILILVGCKNAEHEIVSSDIDLLSRYLGIEMPDTVGDVWFQAYHFSGYRVVDLLAKFEINESQIEEICQRLNLAFATERGAVVPGRPLFGVDDFGGIWNPPDFIEQNALHHRYQFVKDTDRREANGFEFDVVMIWSNGYAFLYKRGLVD
jgi:hypothetical protein